MEHPCIVALRCLGVSGVRPGPKEQYVHGGDCAVCGGDAHAQGPAWRRERVLSDSFAPPETLAAPLSPAVCCACAHFASGRTFHERVISAGLGVKLWPQASWRSYSQIFGGPRGHIIPRRDDWRDFLLTQGPVPSIAILTTAGMKNLVHRSSVARDAELFSVLVEEDLVWGERRLFAGVLHDFEAALEAGFGRDAVLSGSYSTSAILRVGAPRWREVEAAIAPHRAKRLRMLRLAHTAARSPDGGVSTVNFVEKETA